MAIDHRGVKRASGKDYLIWQCVFSYRLTKTIGMQQLPNSVSSPENITMYEVITWRAGGGLPGGAACAMKWPNWLHTYVRFLHDVLPSVNAMHNMRSKGQRCRLVGKRNRVRRRHWRKWRTNETRVSPPLHPSSLRHDEIERCSYNSLEEIRTQQQLPSKWSAFNRLLRTTNWKLTYIPLFVVEHLSEWSGRDAVVCAKGRHEKTQLGEGEQSKQRDRY